MNITGQGFKISSNVALLEHYCEILHRWYWTYWTPVTLSKMFPMPSSKCWRYEDPSATFCHIWWDCLKIRPYWGHGLTGNRKILRHKFPFSLWVYLLHDFLQLKLNASEKMLVLYLCLAASLLIAAGWKSKQTPDKYAWLGKFRFLSLMGKLSAIIKYRQGNYSTFAFI